MRLAKVIIKNFKCLKEVEITIPATDDTRSGSSDFLSIVGENNTGKSSILDAIRLTLPDKSIGKLSEDYFYNHESTEIIEIQLWFDGLSKDEIKDMQMDIHIENDYLKLKVLWNKPDDAPKHFVCKAHFANWPNTTSWGGFSNTGNEWEKLKDLYELEQNHGLPRTITNDAKNEMQRLAIEHNLVPRTFAWEEQSKSFPAQIKKHLPRTIYIPAVKNVSEELGTGRNAAFGQILTPIIDERLQKNSVYTDLLKAEEAVKQLFQDDKAEFMGDIEDLIGNRLSDFIDLAVKLHFKENTSVDEFNFASRTTLKIQDGKVETDPEYQGHGAQRSLILTLLEILVLESAKTAKEVNPHEIIILMEEPEIYLHPQMARKMRDVLLDIAQKPTAQVICTTHSPAFLDLADRHVGIVMLRKAGGVTKIHQQIDDLFEIDDRDRLRMLLNFDSAVNEVFFCKHACLVEGDSELAAIEAYAEKLEKDGKIDRKTYRLVRRDVTVINCRGKWTIAAFQRVLNWFEIPYVVVHDKDKEDLEEGANERIGELAPPDKIRIHDKNFESLIFNKSWSSDKPWRITKAIREGKIHKEPELEDFFLFVLGKDDLTDFQEKSPKLESVE